MINVEACRQIAVEEARLGERQIDLETLKRARQLQAQELAVAEQVALGDRDIADDAFRRRVTGTERQLARRLFLNFDVEHDAILRRSRTALDFDALKDAEAGQPLLGAIDHQRVEGVSFRQAEFAADHVVLGALVADDIDALDIDARTLIDDVGDRD